MKELETDIQRENYLTLTSHLLKGLEPKPYLHNTVAIHLRGGDFSFAGSHFPVLHFSYYVSSLRELIDQDENITRVIVFHARVDTFLYKALVYYLKLSGFDHLEFMNEEDFTYVNELDIIRTISNISKYCILSNSTFSYSSLLFSRHRECYHSS
jgi:hypothetical protein